MSLTGLKNLGPVSVKRLAEVGITTREQLAAAGAVGVYRQFKARDIPVSLNMAYAVEGALLDMHWAQLPGELKERLRQACRDVSS